MTVQDTARTVTVPQQAAPADPAPAPLPPAAPAPAPPAPVMAPLLGRDRPRTADERQFALAIVAMLVALTAIIVTGLLVCQYVWS